MGLFGGGDVFGRRPKYQSAEDAAIQSTDANLRLLPKAEELGGKVNAYNQDQMLAMLRKSIPGYDSLTKAQSDLLASGLRGEVPADVQKQLSMRTAAKSLAGGYAGSGMARNLEARDFGLTSWDITQKSLDSTSRWTESMARLTQPALFNVGSAFISPQQQFDYNKLKADAAAAPDPKKRGNLDTHLGIFGMVTSGYAGGAGYANAYKSATSTGGGGSANWTGGTSGNYLASSSPGYGSSGPFE
jgi:hypothetical protein